jgi:hypothetical protein
MIRPSAIIKFFSFYRQLYYFHALKTRGMEVGGYFGERVLGVGAEEGKAGLWIVDEGAGELSESAVRKLMFIDAIGASPHIARHPAHPHAVPGSLPIHVAAAPSCDDILSGRLANVGREVDARPELFDHAWIGPTKMFGRRAHGEPEAQNVGIGQRMRHGIVETGDGPKLFDHRRGQRPARRRKGEKAGVKTRAGRCGCRGYCHKLGQDRLPLFVMRLKRLFAGMPPPVNSTLWLIPASR